jgi:uncharacterized protein (DUF2345 family)
MFSKQRDLYEQSVSPSQSQQAVTIGTVVDTNDPQQMGRVRVVCPNWGDSWSNVVEDLPWAIYVTPFGGQTQTGARGPGIQESTGGIAYGAWWIPKNGAQVIVMCIDGNPMSRMYMGCIFDQFTPHTLPNGRYMYDDHPELEKHGNDPLPYGPYTSAEKFIQPLADNQHQAFGDQPAPNYEWQTRAADYTAAGIRVDHLNQTYSKVQDDSDIIQQDWISTQGYQRSRIDPKAPSSLTDKNYDNMVYSITSPGFHSFTMDDRQENCRVRIRTTSGAQILIDDTNERIYISTAKGNNWIEMDQDGNIDVQTSNKLNIHAAKDINITADETIRMYAKKGIHMHSDDEVRVTAAKDLHIKTDQNIRIHATQNIYTQSDLSMHFKSGSTLYMTSVGDMDLTTSGKMHLASTGDMHQRSGQFFFMYGIGNISLLSDGPIFETGTQIHLNSTSASLAFAGVAASTPAELLAYWTSRVPAHEPWARTMTKDDTTHTPEFTYNQTDVNKVERGRVIDRGMYWRR